jgi:hypothetical protein
MKAVIYCRISSTVLVTGLFVDDELPYMYEPFWLRLKTMHKISERLFGEVRVRNKTREISIGCTSSDRLPGVGLWLGVAACICHLVWQWTSLSRGAMGCIIVRDARRL